MTRFLDDPWSVITPAVRKAKGQVTAVVAYIGKQAPDILPLKDGDELFCDMSEAAMKAGTTDPKVIKAYLDKNVDIYSVDGLHAKFIILPRKLCVGSMNASYNSKNRLWEAALETTDKDAIKEAREYLGGIVATEVDSEFLRKRAKLYRSTPWSKTPQRKGFAFPKPRPKKLVVVYQTRGDWNTTEIRAHRRGEGEAKSRRKSGKEPEYLFANHAFEGTIKVGDWVMEHCEYEGENHYSAPGEVIWISKAVVGAEQFVSGTASPKKRRKKLEFEKGKLLGLPDLTEKSAKDVKRVLGQKIIEKTFHYFGKDYEIRYGINRHS